MDNYLIIEILVLVFFIVLIAFFVLAKEAMESSLKLRLKERAEEGNQKAELVLHIVDEQSILTCTVHIIIGFLMLCLGTYVASTIALDAYNFCAQSPVLPRIAGILGYVLVLFLVTLIVLLLGVEIPKHVAASHPENIACFVAPWMHRTLKLLGPIARLLHYLGHLVVHAFGLSSNEAESVAEDEVKEIMREGTDLGVFEREEERMVNKVLKLGDRPASSLMTPRNDIIWLDIGKDFNELLTEAYESGHSNFVVGDGTLDTVLGIVSISDMSQYAMKRKGSDFQDILREPLGVQSSLSALKVLETMKEAKKHIAIVVDEYGGLDGIITTHDLIEAVVGEIQDEGEEESSIVHRADNSYLVDASIDIEEIFENFGIMPLAEEDRKGFHSLGGFILAQLGHIPQVGESFVFEDHNFEVVDMDKNRIDKVLIKKL